jgi:8-oxo-dGTP pyrophosphatase MutT (NUDIX family)
MRSWKIERSDVIYSHHILELCRRRLGAGDERRDVLIMEAPDWVNVIPLLDDGRVVLVRQWRYGVQAPTLEIPGGMVDSGEDAATAAARELREETGLEAQTIRPLGFTHPNPAFIANRLTTWLATGLRGLESERESYGVDGEEIRREMVPLAEIPGLIARGEISHALVVAAFYLLGAEGAVSGDR